MPATAPPPSRVRPRRLRLIGLGLGVVVGAATTVALLVAGLASGIAAGASIAPLFGPDGIFAPDRGARFVWAVPPLAAGLAGAILAPRAARRPRWAGTTMGFVTYLIGIVIGPLFVLVLPGLGAAPTVGSSAASILDTVLSLVFGVGVVWVVGGVALAPMLAAFVLAGIAWAAVLRHLVDGPSTVGPPSSRSDASPLIDGPLIAMVVIAGVLGVLWLLLTTFLQLLSGAVLG